MLDIKCHFKPSGKIRLQMRHLDSEDVRGNSLTNATTRSLVAPSAPEPPVTTDPALTNVTGDNYEQRAPLIGQH